MELIDREAFINYICCIVTSPCETRQEQSSALNKQKYTVTEFAKELKRAPLIDAVEVVRCKDCEAYQPTEGGKPFCVVHQIAVCADDFCSYGRRESEET